MMWSAICRGAAGREDSVGASPLEAEGEASWRTYAGEASDRSARSTSERRTRHVRPARTAARRPDFDPRAHGRGMELQLLADLRHRQPRILVWSWVRVVRHPKTSGTRSTE